MILSEQDQMAPTWRYFIADPDPNYGATLPNSADAQIRFNSAVNFDYVVNVRLGRLALTPLMGKVNPIPETHPRRSRCLTATPILQLEVADNTSFAGYGLAAPSAVPEPSSWRWDLGSSSAFRKRASAM